MPESNHIMKLINKRIDLENIAKTGNIMEYSFSASEDLKQYFSDKPFRIEYPDIIRSIPDAILAVPFVCNVLPIVWLTDSKLVIPELDEAFYNCLPAIKKGYKAMYPETEWKGTIEVGKIVSCDRKAKPGKCAAFFSGGLDSVQTLISHLNEKPLLVSIWGSDVKADNEEGWNTLSRILCEVADQFNLSTAVIRSSFREFDNEGELDGEFHTKLKDGWWHGVKHGLGLLGHAAPLAYLHNIETVYIAASNCPEDIDVRCASHPSIDNKIKFVGCRVSHDGFEFSRQDKVYNVAQFKNKYGPVKLHVCWESQSGENCCKCEKCFRTIAALLSEQESPELFGFNKYEQTIGSMQGVVLNRMNPNLCLQWIPIKKNIVSQRVNLKRKSYWKYIKWIEKTDFEHPEDIKIPLSYRLKQAKGFRGKLAEFKFYQMLHRFKKRINN